MSTFARTGFNASAYSTSRPNYPSKLFECIFNYHKRSGSARWERAVDLGCGTGKKAFLSSLCSTSALTHETFVMRLPELFEYPRRSSNSTFTPISPSNWHRPFRGDASKGAHLCYFFGYCTQREAREIQIPQRLGRRPAFNRRRWKCRFIDCGYVAAFLSLA